MTDIQSLVFEFQNTFGQERDLFLQMGLIREEFIELQEEVLKSGSDDFDPYAMAKELGDLAYVVYGLACMAGVNLDTVVQDIHRSNMSKVDDEGNPIFGETGKILKGPNYVPPVFDKKWFG